MASGPFREGQDMISLAFPVHRPLSWTSSHASASIGPSAGPTVHDLYPIWRRSLGFLVQVGALFGAGVEIGASTWGERKTFRGFSACSPSPVLRVYKKTASRRTGTVNADKQGDLPP